MPKALKRARAPSRDDRDDDGADGDFEVEGSGSGGGSGGGGGAAVDADLEEDEAVAEAAAAGVIGASSAAAAASSAVNNKAALREAFLGISQDLPWLERLEVVSAEPLGALNPTEDLKVELALCVDSATYPPPPHPPPHTHAPSRPFRWRVFDAPPRTHTHTTPWNPRSYSQALAAVSAARSEFERLGVPHARPTDYLAEMLKSDAHMKRVKDKLLTEQQRMKAVEVRRRQKDAEAFRKAAAGEKARARATEKRGTLEAVKKWRKQGAGGGAALGLGGGEEEVARGGPRGGGGGGGGGDKRGGPPSKKARKDAKYGFGGKPKRLGKLNDSKSSRDLSSFNPRLMKGKAGGGKGGARPGKQARAAKRGKTGGGRK
jgi:hypothetical protein